ncbi:hypothetical protein APR04_003086 [Promicromonospora umidemergens]|uniref:Uncharacterized protein n=1 Tax=Promicromonospora umidemergens TaxID=629679 RepID=A0ABP8Y093_9MICO|nr:hypothetical protein [Promicromonospora umidemergens]
MVRRFVGAAKTLDRHLTGSALLPHQAILTLDLMVGALALALLVAFLFPLWSAHRWLTAARPSSGSDCSAPSLFHPATSHGHVHSRRLQLVRKDRSRGGPMSMTGSNKRHITAIVR